MMNVIKKFIRNFIDPKMQYSYKLKDGSLLEVGEQKFKTKSIPVRSVGKKIICFESIGTVLVKTKGEKISCPIYLEKNGKISFMFGSEKILFEDLTCNYLN